MHSTLPTGNRLFPIFLKLEQMNVLIVGGGNVGLEKLTAVLRNSPAAPVTLVGREIRDDVRALAVQHPQVTLIEKPFEVADLEDKQIVIAATDDRDLHRFIRETCQQRGILVNVADTPDLCDFYLSSVVQKGDLKIAISTNGKSPTVAKRVKETLTEALPDELDDLLQHMTAIRAQIKGDFSEKVRSLNALTASIAAGEEALTAIVPSQNLERIEDKKWRRIATVAFAAFFLSLVCNVVAAYFPMQTWGGYVGAIPSDFWLFLGVGFLAQMTDGLLGMGYGVTTQICLLSAGVPYAAISSSIHTAEVFTAGASGYSHFRFGNINRRLVRGLLLPGVLGAIVGSLLLVYLGEKNAVWLKPVLAAYTCFLGLRILLKAFIRQKGRKKVKNLGWLAAAGGFLDSFGGGGWGPLVTSTLISKGKSPQYVIGSVSLTEFFVTLASAIAFFSVIGLSHWVVIAGLIVGGVVAAPIAARFAGRLPVRVMSFVVGSGIVFWSLWVLVRALGK
jgi:uncharacterized protein